jgi:hypothetical protein
MKKLERKRRTRLTKGSQANQTKPLSPDPKLLNVRRARWAAAAIEAYQRQTSADTRDAVSDLLTDLMHWCDQFGQAFPEELHRTRGHYAVETAASSTTTAPRLEEL